MDDLDVGRHGLAKPRDEPLVLFDGDDPSGLLRQRGGQDALARPDLDDEVAGLGIDGGDDLAEDARIGQEVLSEGVAAGSVHGAGPS